MTKAPGRQTTTSKTGATYVAQALGAATWKSSGRQCSVKGARTHENHAQQQRTTRMKTARTKDTDNGSNDAANDDDTAAKAEPSRSTEGARRRKKRKSPRPHPKQEVAARRKPNLTGKAGDSIKRSPASTRKRAFGRRALQKRFSYPFAFRCASNASSANQP